MKTIFIARHAKSSWDDSSLPDVVRPLNPRGKKACKAMGSHLFKLRELPDLIISSPATRAYHTALELASGMGYRARNIEVDPAIYYDGEHGVTEALRCMDDEHDSVCIVGHEPICSDVIYRLCGEMTGKFATGSVYKISMDIDSWQAIEDGRGRKVYFISPKQL